jgi:hypothetical protein
MPVILGKVEEYEPNKRIRIKLSLRRTLLYVLFITEK